MLTLSKISLKASKTYRGVYDKVTICLHFISTVLILKAFYSIFNELKRRYIDRNLNKLTKRFAYPSRLSRQVYISIEKEH